MSSSDDYYTAALSTANVYIYRYGTLVIYILGILGNLISITIFLKRKWRKNVCVFYFLIYLLISVVYLNSTVLSTIFIIGWNIKIHNINVFFCKLEFYISFVTSTLFPTVLILASVDRLLISSQNIDTRMYSSRRLAYFLISMSTVFWIAFNTHILVKVNIQQFSLSYSVCYYDFSGLYRNFVNCSLAIFNCLFCLLMIGLSVLSFKNVRRIRAVPRQQQRREVRSMTKKDFQLLRCLFIHDVVYIAESLLLTFYSVYQAAPNTQKQQTSLQGAIIGFLGNLFAFIYFTFHCSSFTIFVCISKAFRQEIKRWINKMIGKDTVILREQEEQQQET